MTMIKNTLILGLVLILASCASQEKKDLRGGYVIDVPAQEQQRQQEEKENQARQELKKVALNILRKNEPLCKIKSESEARCGYMVEIIKDADTNFADGQTVYINDALIKDGEDSFSQEEEARLAWQISYHLAQNILRQPQENIQSSGLGNMSGFLVDLMMFRSGTNTKGGFTRELRKASEHAYTQDDVEEADYLGAYLYTRAGYEPSKILQYINKDQNPERYETMLDTLVEIVDKQQLGKPLIPQVPSRDAFRSDLLMPDYDPVM